MDTETRGLISEIINYVFEQQNVLKTINWVLEVDDQVTSQEDLALGYIIGSLMNIADSIANRKRLIEKTEKRYKKELDKIYGKEGAVKRLEEQDTFLKERRVKGGRPIKVELTEKETEDIKNLLIPMIARFREKIRSEGVLRRV